MAVITKLDRVQADPANVLPLLTGKLYDRPILGIIGIYNRTPADGPDIVRARSAST